MKVRRLQYPTRSQRAAIIALEAAWLYGDKPPCDGDFDHPDQAWWGAFDDEGALVGYGAAQRKPDGSVKLTRAVVSVRARGQGLQQRLIKARVRWARSLGASRVWTYTHIDNPKSSGNLCKAGFYFRGASEDRQWLYWRRETPVV